MSERKTLARVTVELVENDPMPDVKTLEIRMYSADGHDPAFLTEAHPDSVWKSDMERILERTLVNFRRLMETL